MMLVVATGTPATLSRGLGLNTWAQIFLVCFVFAAICFFRIRELGPQVDRAADGYSEANAIRAADAYLKEGFTAHYGLQRIIYGDLFPDAGAVRDKRFFSGAIPADRNAYAYTHYPPGPDYIVAVTAMFTGLQNTELLRFVPAAFTMVAMLALMVVVSHAFRPAIWGPLIGALLIAPPIFCRFAVGLHLQPYTTAAMLLAIAICIHAFWLVPRLNRWHLLALGFLGFFQGWMSFDSCFVTVFCVAPIWLLAKSDGRPVTWRALFSVMIVSGIGFGLAHFLHLLQVAGELGGLQAAIVELGGAAKYRGGLQAAALTEIPHRSYPEFVWTAIWSHLYLLLIGFKEASRRETFAFSMIFVLLVLLVVHLNRSGKSSVRLQHLIAVMTAMLIALAWSVAMPQHAAVHATFTLRHFLLMYLVAALSAILWLNGSTRGRVQSVAEANEARVTA